MLEFIKIKRRALLNETLDIKGRERHYLQNARALRGIFSKRHGLDEPVPEMPEHTARASKVEEAEDKARRDYDLFWGLHHHRQNVVRKEARDIHIAYCFLKGRDFEQIEQSRYTNPDWKNIERMVLTFGSGIDQRILQQQFAEWLERAKSMVPMNWNFPK